VRGRGRTHDFGSNDFARAAPGRETVDDHEGVLVGEGVVEVGLTVADICRQNVCFICGVWVMIGGAEWRVGGKRDSCRCNVAEQDQYVGPDEKMKVEDI
jgi:hypothetical protein